MTTGPSPYTYRWQMRSRAFLRRYRLCGDRPASQAPVMSACWKRRRENPYAGVRAATCVDHISPHRGDRALFWDEAHNWQALCAACHLAKTRAGL